MLYPSYLLIKYAAKKCRLDIQRTEYAKPDCECAWCPISNTQCSLLKKKKEEGDFSNLLLTGINIVRKSEGLMNFKFGTTIFVKETTVLVKRTDKTLLNTICLYDEHINVYLEKLMTRIVQNISKAIGIVCFDFKLYQKHCIETGHFLSRTEHLYKHAFV